MPLFKGSVNSARKTSLGLALHGEALANALVTILEALPDAPIHRRVLIRQHLAALMRAYPELEAASQLDAERFLQEEEDEEDLPTGSP